MISKLGILTIVWVALLLLGLAFIPIYKQVDFDPESRLLMLSMDVEFDQSFVQKMTHKLEVVNSTIVHFTSDDCVCDSFAERHHFRFEKLLGEQGYISHTINIEANSELASRLPATPAVAIFDEQGQLSYLGPYAAGMGCFAGPGFVEQIVNYVLAEPAGAWVNSDNTGCYCHL